MRRARDAVQADGFVHLTEQLEPYLDGARVRERRLADSDDGDSPVFDELMERAATLLAVMPPNQRRVTIEQLVCPHDPERGRRAVNAIIDAGLATEDYAGCLRATSGRQPG